MGIYLTQLKSRVGTSFRYPNKVTRTLIFLATSFFASFILKLAGCIYVVGKVLRLCGPYSL